MKKVIQSILAVLLVVSNAYSQDLDVCTQQVLDVERAVLVNNEITLTTPVVVRIPVLAKVLDGLTDQMKIGFEILDSNGDRVYFSHTPWKITEDRYLEIGITLQDYMLDVKGSFRIVKAELTNVGGVDWVQDISKLKLAFTHKIKEKNLETAKEDSDIDSQLQLNHWTIAPIHKQMVPGETFRVSINVESKRGKIGLLSTDQYSAIFDLADEHLLSLAEDSKMIRIPATSVEKSTEYKNVYYLNFTLPARMPSAYFDNILAQFSTDQGQEPLKISLHGFNHFDVHQAKFKKEYKEKGNNWRLYDALTLQYLTVKGNVTVQELNKLNFDLPTASLGDALTLTGDLSPQKGTVQIGNVAIEIEGSKCKAKASVWGTTTSTDDGHIQIQLNMPSTLPQDRYCITNVWANYKGPDGIKLQKIVEQEVFAGEGKCINIGV